MLRPEQEVTSAYLRSLQLALTQVILPDVRGAVAHRAVTLCGEVLAGLVAPDKIADEAVPAGAPGFAVTADSVERYLQQRFADPGLRVGACRQITGGRSKITVMVSIAAHPALPGEIVLRFDNPGSAQDTTVLDEYPVLDAIYRNNILGPEPLWLEADPRPLGARFLAMRKMAGGVPGTFWEAGDATPALALDLADALAAMHRVEAGRVWPNAPCSARDAVGTMLDRLETRWRGADAVSSVALELGFGWVKRQLGSIDGGSRVVHGDVHFANVLAEGDRLICLTDWEFCHPGHPAEDLAFCRGYIESLMPWDAFLTRYHAAGGAPVTESQLRFFAVWGLLRNATLAACVLAGMAHGAPPDLQSLYIALHARAKVEAALSQTLASEFNRAAR